MVKLLVVDDEEEIRNGIIEVIDWASQEITICGQASNGHEAVKLIEEASPDIILLDIRMPIMDGLELLSYIKDHNIVIKVIILSGYDDFAYAHKALKLGAFDYLLKPCRPEEILSTVLRAKLEIESDSYRRQSYKNLKTEFNKSLPILKEKYLYQISLNSSNFKKSIEQSFRLYGIKIKAENIVVSVIKIDDFDNLFQNSIKEDIELMKFAICNISQEILSTQFRCEVFENNNEVICIINIQAINITELLNLLNEVRVSVCKFLDFTVSIGLGLFYEDISKISTSYSEAIIALETRFFIGINRVISYDEIKNLNIEAVYYPLSEEHEILNNVRSGNLDNIQDKVEDFFCVLLSHHSSRDYFVKCGLTLMLSAYHLCVEKGLNTDEVFGQGLSYFNEFQKLDTLQGLQQSITKILVSCTEKITSKKCSNKIIELALKFIDDNYPENLNLEKVANFVFITPAYLSLLFKQVMGLNFVDYLHKVRVEKACQLSRDVRLKSYEIASMVGYNDEKYFSQIFKKVTGMTISQYRENKF